MGCPKLLFSSTVGEIPDKKKDGRRIRFMKKKKEEKRTNVSLVIFERKAICSPQIKLER